MAMQLSRELLWFMNTMQEQFGIWMDATAISTEATELGMDEVDECFIPKGAFDKLPPTLLYELMIYDDDLYTTWLGAVAFYPDSPEWCLQIILRDDKIVYHEVLQRPSRLTTFLNKFSRHF